MKIEKFESCVFVRVIFSTSWLEGGDRSTFVPHRNSHDLRIIYTTYFRFAIYDSSAIWNRSETR